MVREGDEGGMGSWEVGGGARAEFCNFNYIGIVFAESLICDILQC